MFFLLFLVFVFFLCFLFVNEITINKKGSEVGIPDVQRVYKLLVDKGRSEQFLKEYEGQFVFHSAEDANADANNDKKQSIDAD